MILQYDNKVRSRFTVDIELNLLLWFVQSEAEWHKGNIEIISNIRLIVQAVLAYNGLRVAYKHRQLVLYCCLLLLYHQTSHHSRTVHYGSNWNCKRCLVFNFKIITSKTPTVFINAYTVKNRVHNYVPTVFDIYLIRWRRSKDVKLNVILRSAWLVNWSGQKIKQEFWEIATYIFVQNK